jgi:2-hydroxy-3-keto-5-methylthiopentenyl-1-phosphate phosphatase
MLKKTITYEDFDGNKRTEDFYFNLTKAEVTEMEMSTEGGLTKMLEKIVSAQDGKRIIETFKDLILRAYGEKSPDGKRFIKSQELRDTFSQNQAYSELFMELATNAEAAAAFVNGIIPVAPNK